MPNVDLLLLAVAAVILVAARSTADAARTEYFRLHHLEYQTLFIDVDDSQRSTHRGHHSRADQRSQIAAGRTLVTRRHQGLEWYTDDENRVRTRIGDLCVHENADGILELAACSGGNADWTYYFDKGSGVGGLVRGSSDDESTMRIAVWDSKKNIYEKHGAKLVSKPFAEAKNDFGAEWFRKWV